MLQNIQHLFYQYITIGSEEHTSLNTIKKIKILNVACFIWLLTAIISAIIYYLKHEFNIITFSFMLFSILSIQAFLYFKKNIKVASLLFIINLNLILFLYVNFIPHFKGVFMEVFLIFPPSISLIFFERKKTIYFILCISFIIFFFPNLYFHHYPFKIFNNINTFILFFSVFIALNYFKNLNHKNEKALEERKKELETINQFQSQFFINVSHEIRTPITLIKGDIDQITDFEETIPQLKRIRKNLNSEVNKITAMVNDVLDLSKIEASNFNIYMSEISITSLLQKLHASFETIFKQKEIDFVLHTIHHDFLINADLVQLSRAISNIIVNASKYTDKFGKVSLTAYKENDQVIISIADTGIGISEIEIDKICNQFYQVNNDINRAGGSGVGLSLTKEIINLHNGLLTIDSKPGKGSIFKIILPLKNTLPIDSLIINNSVQENLKSEDYLFLKSSKKLFLIVDDNLKMCNYIAAVLDKNGYQSIHAENGVEALNLITKHTFHFIITDYMMPKMNGVSFIENLKKLKIDLPVLMLTARNDSQSRLNVFKLGIDDFITKPFENKEFIIRVKNALKNYEQRTIHIKQHEITQKEIENNSSWIFKVEKFIYDSCIHIDFKKSDISTHFNISDSSVYRRIKSQTGLTPNNFIKEIRLQKAKEIINDNPDILLKQLVSEIGFKHISYFSKIFTERFGYKPLQNKKDFNIIH